jgi:sirohydrochlorin ferrochelatase
VSDRLPALVAVAHGSRDPRAATVAEALGDLVCGRRPDLDVRVAYLDHTAPDVGTVLRGLHGGAVLAPLLLTEAFHTRVDLPAVVEDARRERPHPPVRQAAALGPHPLLLAAAERRLREAGETVGDPGTAVVLAAAGSTDPRALEVVRDVAGSWAARGWWAVVPAYASASGPTVAEAVAALRERGAPRVVVSAYVLAPGFLPDRIAAGASAADGLAEPLGACDELAELVLRRYTEALAR